MDKQNEADRCRQRRNGEMPGTNSKTSKARREYDLENNVYKKNITEKGSSESCARSRTEKMIQENPNRAKRMRSRKTNGRTKGDRPTREHATRDRSGAEELKRDIQTPKKRKKIREGKIHEKEGRLQEQRREMGREKR